MRMGDVVNGTGRKVTATLSGSAAEAAGLQIGDVVMSVDGIPSSQIDEPALKRFMRGPVGSSVDLVVHRSDSVRPQLQCTSHLQSMHVGIACLRQTAHARSCCR